jgi:steroid delta-isomerase-like uncharacterized protein
VLVRIDEDRRVHLDDHPIGGVAVELLIGTMAPMSNVRKELAMTAVLTDILTADAMVEIARDQVNAFNKSDWKRMRAKLSSDSRYDELGTARKIRGPEKIIEAFKGWKQAFPDAVGTVTSAVASGDKVVLEVTWKGTQTGPLVTADGTIPASGKLQKTPAALVYTFSGDKVEECRQYFDSLTLLRQIGVQPK